MGEGGGTGGADVGLGGDVGLFIKQPTITTLLRSPSTTLWM